MTEAQVMDTLHGKWITDDGIADLTVTGNNMVIYINGNHIDSHFEIFWNDTLHKWQINAPDYSWYIAFLADVSENAFKVYNCDYPAGTPIEMHPETLEILNPKKVFKFQRVTA